MTPLFSLLNDTLIDKSSVLKNQGSLYLEFNPEGGLFHNMLLLSLMGFETGWWPKPCLNTRVKAIPIKLEGDPLIYM